MTVEGFQALAQRLQQGEPALFPTDTLPALAAIPEAAQAIWQLKQRPADKPLILMGASVEQLLPCLGQEPPDGWQHLAELGWPGAHRINHQRGLRAYGTTAHRPGCYKHASSPGFRACRTISYYPRGG